MLEEFYQFLYLVACCRASKATAAWGESKIGHDQEAAKLAVQDFARGLLPGKGLALTLVANGHRLTRPNGTAAKFGNTN